MARLVVPAASVEEVELERENGRWVWKVGFANDIEVKIDGRAGKILDIDDDW
ncbi:MULTISPECIES: PepSY domain-containing protein [unclassified Synechococcus]|uniref:PepSY domain-containing protein n=1 Tax=unclassified Synechococcus TaxID=2626047 RepID=UPI003207A6C5